MGERFGVCAVYLSIRTGCFSKVDKDIRMRLIAVSAKMGFELASAGAALS